MKNQNKLLLVLAVALFSILGTMAGSQQSIAATIAQCACGQPQCSDCVSAPATASCGNANCSGCSSCSPAPAMNACECGESNCDSCVRSKRLRSCRCNKSSCRTCRLRSRARPCRSCNSQCGGTQCPSCDEDVCKLELDNSKVKKTCFKVEQKSICIPPVRFPWQKCCPPGTAKTRLVNKLSVHTYECPNCAYKWTLQEAKASAPSAPQVAPQKYDVYPTESYDQNEIYQTPQQQDLMPVPTSVIETAPRVPAAPPTSGLTPTWRVDQPLGTTK